MGKLQKFQLLRSKILKVITLAALETISGAAKTFKTAALFPCSKSNMRLLSLLLFIPTLFFCRHVEEEPLPSTPNIPAEQIDILALGDSYTKGESVKWEANYPNQLKDKLRVAGFASAEVHVVAQTGWRTDQLQAALNAQADVLEDSVFSIVTLCIGVNNQYQNGNLDLYKLHFESLLQYAIERAGGRKSRVFVLSIPDYAFTPFGQSWGNPEDISAEIDQFNVANRAITAAYAVQYVDVTGISRRGVAEPLLVANDGLHPSAIQYAEWLQLLFPAVKNALQP